MKRNYEIDMMENALTNTNPSSIAHSGGSAYEHLADTIEMARLTAIREIVATVNHEINNPLTAIIGNAELLDRSLQIGDQQNLQFAIESISDAAMRIKQVTQSLANIRSSDSQIYVGTSRMTRLQPEL